MPRTADNLTFQQNAFCQEYVKDYKGGASAIRAGYAPKASRQQASDLLTRPYIRLRIEELEAAKARIYRVSVEEVAAELAKFAFLDIKTQFANVNESGVTLKDFAQLDGTLIAQVNEKRGKDGDTWIEVKFPDKMKALELLGKHLGMFDAKKPSDPDAPQGVEKSLQDIAKALQGRDG